ncbi:transcriptional regulatory [Lecanosticta acicola]|uniref:Transcriptional regulatory n=1 Tax=Lecanosticta acicola TaxID=111012 RepID=A0AAI8Z6I1_9PEZI|nr:transcriptional regulatory [Lecanosticta acicola]
MKRTYQQMLGHHAPYVMSMDGSVQYHNFNQGHPYCSPPAPPHQPLLFSSPFPSQNEYVSEGYIPVTESMSYFMANRSLSEPFIHEPTESFGSSTSGESSCSVSIAPATPPPPPPMKFPAVPITPSHVVSRQKAKRTATACEECRKRKQKCDGETPCQSCKEQKLDCKYREVTPSKKDSSVERLVALVASCSKSMEALNTRLDVMSSSLEIIERRLSHCWQCGSDVELQTGYCDSCRRKSPKYM